MFRSRKCRFFAPCPCACFSGRCRGSRCFLFWAGIWTRTTCRFFGAIFLINLPPASKTRAGLYASNRQLLRRERPKRKCSTKSLTYPGFDHQVQTLHSIAPLPSRCSSSRRYSAASRLVPARLILGASAADPHHLLAKCHSRPFSLLDARRERASAISAGAWQTSAPLEKFYPCLCGYNVQQCQSNAGCPFASGERSGGSFRVAA
jgi:hypothetical protein